ncbi:hypothetical protein VaNZ11_016989 [Volvox africanus]|uniref:Uncharacterized protein n=1 Tax=Volvox africanus TaxID=51714 RepID=A0ABQ5SNZ2_9CHLO|nr:hypothetical protein VaNZ11_016989 [Volvox africanus]
MKSLENDLILIVHSCLQIDEDSRRSWAARNAPKFAQRLKQLLPEPCADVGRVADCLQRRRRPLCWCLLLLGGRVDVQLHVTVELFSQCVHPGEATFLQQHAAELTMHQQQYNQQQVMRQQQQQQLELQNPQTINHVRSSQGRDGMAGTPCLLPDDAIQPPEVLQYCTQQLAAMLTCVGRDQDCLEVISHVALRRNGALLACLVRMLTPITPVSANSSDVAAAGVPNALPVHPQAARAHAARILSCLSECSEVRGQLLATGAVQPLLACLSADFQQHHVNRQELQAHHRHQQQQYQLMADAARCLARLSSMEAAGREMLRVQGPMGIESLITLLNGAAGAAAVESAVLALAALTAHPTLRPGLVAAGATEALMTLVELSGGPFLAAWIPDYPSSSHGSPGCSSGSPVSATGGGAAALVKPNSAQHQTMELALLALVRCIRSYGGGGTVAAAAAGTGATSGAARTATTQNTAAAAGGNSAAGVGEIPVPMLQLLLDMAATPVRPHQSSQPHQPSARSSPSQAGAALAAPLDAHGMDYDGSDHPEPQPQLPAGAMAVVEATEALADVAREVTGALRVLSFGGHLVMLQRLLAAMPGTPATASCPLPPLEPLSRRQLDACLRGLARIAMAAPSHPDIYLARTHEVLLHVLLGMGLADRPGWWALQGLCALAADVHCATDLVAAGALPPVVAALRGLAAAPSLRRYSSTARHRLNLGAVKSSAAPQVRSLFRAHGGGCDGGDDGGINGPAAATRVERDIEVAHLLGLLLQNLAGHKALARVAVEEGAVPAICEWMAVCAGGNDVEGAVLCCATLCLLGDGDPGALVDMVHANGIDTLVDLLHPRWATASLVPSTVAAAIAVACRWPASAQAVRMAAGIPALADTLRGPHGLACCRPVVSALVDLTANDPPALREIRTTNTVISLGTQLQLLPNNDPRAGRIRLLLRQLGEDPDTAMRLANSEADNAIANAAAAPHHHHHHLNHHHNLVHYQNLPARAGARHPNAGALRLQLRAAAAAAGGGGGGGGGSWRWRFIRTSDSGSGRRPQSLADSAPAAAAGEASTSPNTCRSFRASSPGSIVPEEPSQGSRWRMGEAPLSARDDLDCVLAALRGESSYKSLRRASLQQLAKRMDASDFSDVEDDVEDYMAILEVASRDQNTSLSRNPSMSQRNYKGRADPRVTAGASQTVAGATTVASAAGLGSQSTPRSAGNGGAAHVICTSANTAPEFGAVAATASLSLVPAISSPASAQALPPAVGAEGAAKGSASKQGSAEGASRGRGPNGAAAVGTSGLTTALAVVQKPGDDATGLDANVGGVVVEAVQDDAFASSNDTDSGDGLSSGGGEVALWRRHNQLQQRHHSQNHLDGCGNGQGSFNPGRHRYSGCGCSSQGHHSIDQVPPSVDIWLEAEDPDCPEPNNRHPKTANNQERPDVAELFPSQPDLGGPQSRCYHQDDVGDHHDGGSETEYPYSYTYTYPLPLQHPHPQDQELRPMGWRGRSAVVHTLAAVNPLRLFGGGRRGPKKKAADSGGGGGDGGEAVERWSGDRGGVTGGCDSCGAPRVGGGRRSLQVDGEELVYWSADL